MDKEASGKTESAYTLLPISPRHPISCGGHSHPVRPIIVSLVPHTLDTEHPASERQRENQSNKDEQAGGRETGIARRKRKDESENTRGWWSGASESGKRKRYDVPQDGVEESGKKEGNRGGSGAGVGGK